jgi:hypothetical protein
MAFVAPDDMRTDRYLLTPDCVVKNLTHGTGTWGYDDGGWQISFGNQFELYFPGPMPPLELSDCQLLR